MKKKSVVVLLFVLSLILFVAGWYAVSRINSSRKPVSIKLLAEPAKKPGTIKVASYNIAHGRGGSLGEKNWKHKSKEDLLNHLDEIVKQIKGENPDIILLNEVDFSAAWSFNVDQAQYIGDKCGYLYLLEQKNMDVSFPFYRFCFGNAILSKYPIAKQQFIQFAPYSKWEDIFIGNHDGFFCELILPFGTVGVFGIHLEYRSENVRVKAATVIAEMSSKMTCPVIALGDFNSTPKYMPKSEKSVDGQNAMDYFFGEANFLSYLSQDIQIFSFPSEKPDRLIDWIIGKGIKSFTNSRIVQSGLSDHLMIVTEAAF